MGGGGGDADALGSPWLDKKYVFQFIFEKNCMFFESLDVFFAPPDNFVKILQTPMRSKMWMPRAGHFYSNKKNSNRSVYCNKL